MSTSLFENLRFLCHTLCHDDTPASCAAIQYLIDADSEPLAVTHHTDEGRPVASTSAPPPNEPTRGTGLPPQACATPTKSVNGRASKPSQLSGPVLSDRKSQAGAASTSVNSPYAVSRASLSKRRPSSGTARDTKGESPHNACGQARLTADPPAGPPPPPSARTIDAMNRQFVDKWMVKLYGGAAGKPLGGRPSSAALTAAGETAVGAPVPPPPNRKVGLVAGRPISANAKPANPLPLGAAAVGPSMAVARAIPEINSCYQMYLGSASAVAGTPIGSHQRVSLVTKTRAIATGTYMPPTSAE